MDIGLRFASKKEVLQTPLSMSESFFILSVGVALPSVFGGAGGCVRRCNNFILRNNAILNGANASVVFSSDNERDIKK